MSSRRPLARVAKWLVNRLDPAVRHSACWLPVLHVERLQIAENRAATVKFCKTYAAMTGKRVMATVMTPRSPMVRRQLELDGYPEEAYADALGEVALHADIGLHGHYLRGENWPQQAGFHDISAIRLQLASELAFLREHDLVVDGPLAYSAGWWFMTPNIQKILIELGFEIDFSLSLSGQNFCISSHIARREFELGDRIAVSHGNRILLSAYALASTNRGDSHFTGLIRHGALHWREPRPRFLTLYSHDYDIDPEESLRATEALLECGFSFFAAGELSDFAVGSHVVHVD